MSAGRNVSTLRVPESHCGHDAAQFMTSAEGTSYCPACEAAAQPADDAPEFFEGTLADGLAFREEVERPVTEIAPAAAEAYRALCRLEDELDRAWITRTALDDLARSQIGQLRDRWVNETSRKMTRAVKTKAKPA